MVKKQETEIIPLQTNAIVMPAVNATEAITAWKGYQDLKKAIVEKSDIQLIEKNEFLKKSYWRKVATFFNLTTKVVEEKNEQLGKTLVWHFTVEAIAPNGRSASGVGSCDAFEKAVLRDGKYMKKGPVTKWGKNAAGKSYPLEFEWIEAIPNSIHNIRTTAETRATNRAISNLVGGGEVSAEEVDQHEIYQKEDVVEAGEVVEETPKATPAQTSLKCEDCSEKVTQGVADFSIRNTGKVYCMKHQKDHLKK